MSDGYVTPRHRGIGLPPPPDATRNAQWMILGCQEADGTVTVYGSVEMTQAELRAVIEQRRPPLAPGLLQRGETSVTYAVSAAMRSFVEASGDTYADALRRLMASWSPDEQRAIGSGS